MSTVPEIEMGGNFDLKTLTISTLTNYAAGISKNKLSEVCMFIFLCVIIFKMLTIKKTINLKYFLNYRSKNIYN